MCIHSAYTCFHTHMYTPTNKQTSRYWEIHGGNKKVTAGLLSREQRRDSSCPTCFVEDGARGANCASEFSVVEGMRTSSRRQLILSFTLAWLGFLSLVAQLRQLRKDH